VREPHLVKEVKFFQQREKNPAGAEGLTAIVEIKAPAFEPMKIASWLAVPFTNKHPVVIPG
jgi:hypothetical protein